MPETNKSKNIYALIIGINKYPRNPLYGCVNDALAVHEFCSQLAEVNEEIGEYHPKFLLAPHPDEDRAALKQFGLKPGDYEPPTRDNIIKAFSHFKQAEAENGDICLLYYSGHGSFQGAPEIFWDLKSGKQVESIVCVDSRVAGGRDLIDKELAYLLWDAIHDKTSYREGEPGVHTLLIMDCCHSGDNTRGAEKQVIRSRMERPNTNGTPLEEYVGYPKSAEKGSAVESDARFLKALEQWRSARYVHLAAARDRETAKETMLEDRSSGVFTYSLLKTLRNGGMQLSYKELVERIKVMVRNRVDEQIPLLFSTEPNDGQLTFMGGGLREPVQEYVVYFDSDNSRWMLNAGANAGLVPSNELGKTTLKIWRKGEPEQTREAEVLKVGPADSELDGDDFTMGDQEHEDWMARITHMNAPKVKVFIDQSADEKIRQSLQEEIGKIKVPTFEFVDREADATYVIHYVKKELVLTKKGSVVPVFKRSSKVEAFLVALQSVGRWLRVLELKNDETSIKRSDIDVHIEVMEGVRLAAGNLNSVKPTRKPEENPEEVIVAYKKQNGKQVQPGIRVKLTTTEKPYYVACLYLDSQYGIHSNLGSTEIRPEGSGEWLKFSNDGIEYRTIPLNFESKYHRLGITEITDYLKIFVSTQEFPVNMWLQESLELDEKLLETTRSARSKAFGFEEDENESFENASDWTSFTIPIRIKRPLKTQEEAVGGSGSNVATIGGAKLTVPQGFSAKVSAASTGEVKEMVNSATERSIAGNDELRKSLLPPPIIWGSAPSRYSVFSRGVSAADPDAQLSVLELTGAIGDTIVSQENPLIFEPDGGVNEDEVLISFAYDQDTGMYLPLGFSDEEGKVHIEHLPKETPGKIIGDEAINERSLSGSIKLFFKKVVIGRLTGQDNNNTLAVCSLGDDGVSAARVVGDGELADPEIEKVCLLIHGIIGDTEVQRQAFFENGSTLHEHFDKVISYDYENLNTPIEETAKLLKADLAKAGITEAGGKRLTIVAHSMGGLVSRWFIEQEGGDKVVSRLIQLGTPNGGSETSDFRKSVFSMMSMAMNGAAFLKPYLPVLSFIGKRLTKALFKTLDQMSPTESEFLKELNAEKAATSGVPYTVIGGNTHLIKPERLDTQPLLKQFWQAIKTRAPYELLNKLVFKSENPNDMAVTQVSMQIVPTQSDLPFHSVGCDHISYFCFDDAMDKLKEVLEAPLA